jgi:hypothetical protein
MDAKQTLDALTNVKPQLDAVRSQLGVRLDSLVNNPPVYRGAVRLVSGMDGSKALHTSDNATVNLVQVIHGPNAYQNWFIQPAYE